MQLAALRQAIIVGLVFTLGSAWVTAPASAERHGQDQGGIGGDNGNNGDNGETGENDSPVPTGAVDVTGTITALGTNAGTVQVTTDHGTAVTLTTNASTQVQPNGTLTALSNLAVGQAIEVIYKPADKIALALVAAPPTAGVVFGAITALDLTGGTLQITPLVGSPQTVKLNAQTQFALNEQPVAATAVAVGQLAAIQSATDGTVTAVDAETPPLVNLAGTITALNVSGGTLEVTTPAATSITLQLAASALIQLNGATATADKLGIGDQVKVEYEYRLLPGSSRVLAIVAQTAAPTPTPTPAAAIASLTLNPPSVKGGASATGTVTLSAAAPAAGAVITLASSKPTAAAIPGTVTVAAGATTATFTVTTTTVTANTPVAIFASYGGATSMATLTVTP